MKDKVWWCLLAFLSFAPRGLLLSGRIHPATAAAFLDQISDRDAVYRDYLRFFAWCEHMFHPSLFNACHQKKWRSKFFVVVQAGGKKKLHLIEHLGSGVKSCVWLPLRQYSRRNDERTSVGQLCFLGYWEQQVRKDEDMCDPSWL